MEKLQIDGIRTPDSKLAKEATELIKDTASELLFKHSLRVYYWGGLTGQRRCLNFDLELLYVAAMFHDFGLTSKYEESQIRFEVDGANAARDFLAARGISSVDVERVWLAIALHTTPGIPAFLQPEIALLQEGAGMDVAGRGYAEFTEAQRKAVVDAFPRGYDFSEKMIQTFYDGLKHRPDSTFGTFNDDFLAQRDPSFKRVNLCSVIRNSPWEHQH
jgi:hypothetical protein